MKQETVIANLVREAFPNQSVSVKAGPYSYLHHDNDSFGDRTIPSFAVTLKAKTSTTTVHGRKQPNDVGPWDVVSLLRNNGYFATYNGSIVIANVGESELPVNKAFPIEWK